MTCDGLDSLEWNQTQRFYRQRWAQVWCSSHQHEHRQLSNSPLLWCPNNEELGLVVVQFKIIVQHPWTDFPYAVFDTFHRKKCVHIKWSQLPKWNMVNFKGGRVAFSLKSRVRLSENRMSGIRWPLIKLSEFCVIIRSRTWPSSCVDSETR